MADFEVVPIDGEGPSIIDELPTEEAGQAAPVDDIPDDPSVPEGGEPESTEEAPEPEPDRLMYASEVDELPTEDTDEEPVIDDEPDGGERPYEPDVNDNVADIPIVGSASEGDVIPVLMRSGAPLGISPVGWGDRMQSDVDLASQAATEAKAVAQATGQHFWEDDNGAHVTEITKDDWKAEEAKETPFADVSDAKPYHNLLMNSLGILLRTALKNLVSITRSAIAFFDGEGNNAANVVASFGKDGSQVGPSSKVHSMISAGGFALKDRNDTAFVDFHLANDDSTGTVNVVWEMTADGDTDTFTFRSDIVRVINVKLDGTTQTTGWTLSGNSVVFSTAPAAGTSVEIIVETHEPNPVMTFGTRNQTADAGLYSRVLGIDCEASGYLSHAEGFSTKASYDESHAEGYQSVASGWTSHAEGIGSTASAGASHAEGLASSAIGDASHAEGRVTVSGGTCSHAEGKYSLATGENSHAQNLGTIAAGENQTAIGRWNVSDTDETFAVIIGNGTSSSNRSDALTVGWDGSVDAAGNVEVGGSVVMKDQTIDRDGAHASADQWHTVHKVLDADGDTIEEMRVVRRASGRMESLWSVYNDNNGAKVENVVRIGVNENGTNVIGLTGGAAWRTAIGLGIYASLTKQSADLTLTTSAQKVPLHGTFAQYGGCSESSNGIKVPVAGVYLITGIAYFTTGFAVSDIIHIELRKNNSSLGESLFRVYHASPYQSFAAPTQIVSLAANDVITLHARNQTAARGTVASGNGHGITLVKIA